jgi:FkbM family methyltransferase
MFSRVTDWWRSAFGRRLGRLRSADRKFRQDCCRKLVAMGATFADDGMIEIQGVKFHPSYPMFPWVLWGIACSENYGFTMPGQWVVFDVGANAGATSLWLGRLQNVVKVYAMEPVGPTFQLLAANLRLNPAIGAKVEAMQIGLGDRREIIEVPYHPIHSHSISSKHTYDKCFQSQSMEKMQIEAAAETLAPLVARHGQERKFLKVDCEGAEYDVLPNLAEAGLLEQMDVIIIEWHQGNHETLVSILENRGFFCFVGWSRRDRWHLGFIKAVNLKNRPAGETPRP